MKIRFKSVSTVVPKSSTPGVFSVANFCWFGLSRSAGMISALVDATINVVKNGGSIVVKTILDSGALLTATTSRRSAKHNTIFFWEYQ